MPPLFVQANKSGDAMPERSDAIKVYMHDIGHFPLVSKEEEIELAAAIRKGSEEARTKLIRSNLRLVVKIAHDFKGLGLPLCDLISEGNIGLMRAVEKFDPAKGAKFSSYAAWWIKQAMRRALANQSRTIRIPVQSAYKLNRIRAVRLQLTQKFGREPRDWEIAEVLDFSCRTISGLCQADLRGISLNDPVQCENGTSFEEVIADCNAVAPDKMLGKNESLAHLQGMLGQLDEREERILRMRFGLDGDPPKTLEEVSLYIGRTRERVRQIQNLALDKLKEMLQADLRIRPSRKCLRKE